MSDGKVWEMIGLTRSVTRGKTSVENIINLTFGNFMDGEEKCDGRD